VTNARKPSFTTSSNGASAVDQGTIAPRASTAIGWKTSGSTVFAGAAGSRVHRSIAGAASRPQPRWAHP
jgi:hypothetical protein